MDKAKGIQSGTTDSKPATPQAPPIQTPVGPPVSAPAQKSTPSSTSHSQPSSSPNKDAGFGALQKEHTESLSKESSPIDKEVSKQISDHKKVVEETGSLDWDNEEIRNKLSNLPVGSKIDTIYDTLYDTLKNSKKMTYRQLAAQTGLSQNQLDEYLRLFSKEGVVTISYPLLFLTSPTVEYIYEEPIKSKTLPLTDRRKLLEDYTVFAEYVVVNVKLWSEPLHSTPIYEIIDHKIGMGTELLMKNLISQLASIVSISNDDITDAKKLYAAKKYAFESALTLIKKHIDIAEELQYTLAGTMLHRFFGLGDLEVVMLDNWLEEVAINSGTEPLSLYHKRYGWVKTTRYFNREGEIYNISAYIGRKVGKQINSLDPIMDAHLQTGDRVAATLFPISTEGDTITIRRFSRNPWTVVHMVDEKNHTMSKEILSFLWLAIQYELNIIVAGGTASGKTSALNTLASLIPPTNRIISIEDTRELSLPSELHWNWVPLNSKSANAEGQGEVSMLDLMVASLRMRPDRILVGEIRRKAQAEAMFEAMHTGHSVSATMHADTSEQVKHRLTQPPIDIPENELQALHLVVVQYRDRRRGIRRTLEVSELLPGSGDNKVNMNYLFRWRPRNDTFVKEEESIRVVEDLNLHTGMTQKEIEQDLVDKERVLTWLQENKLFDVDKVGHVMRIYYKYPKILYDIIDDNGKWHDLVQTTK
jgi:flagellar protein FlaI